MYLFITKQCFDSQVRIKFMVCGLFFFSGINLVLHFHLVKVIKKFHAVSYSMKIDFRNDKILLFREKSILFTNHRELIKVLFKFFLQ